MVDPSAILAAKRMAIQARKSASNGPSYGTGAQSPLFQQYGGWGNSGAGYMNPLPRPAEDFTDAAFGPLTPIKPMGINEPPDGYDRPQPRRWQYPVGWDMPVGQPGSEGFKLANFNTLRTLGNLYSIARSCIRLRINELRGMSWDIVPTKEAEKSMRGDSGKHKDFQNRRAEALKFFRRPDPDYHDFSSWLAACMEEVFVIDALSLYLQPTVGASTTWGKGKGLLGSDLAHLCLIDGATVRPMVDVYGAVPRPPSIAYQVYEYGVPRVDLMTLITGDDQEELGEKPVAEYRGDQLLYLPYNPQRWTPYGFTPIEGGIVPIIAGLRKQQWQSNYFDEGTVPRAYISPGDPSMTPSQMHELQTALNAVAGDPAWHHKIIVLPPNSKVDPMVNTELADQFDEIVMTQVAMSFDVMPMELGIMPKVSTTTSPGAANQMSKASEGINQRKSLKPMMLWLKTCIFDKILKDVCGQADMEWRWEELVEGEDEEALIGMISEQIKLGLLSIDEGRIELGRQPWGLPITSDPGVLLGTGFVPLGAIDPATGAPAVMQPTLPGEAGVPQPSLPAPGEAVPTPPAPGSNGSSSTAASTPVPGKPQAGQSKPQLGQQPAQSPGHTGGASGNAQAQSQSSTGTAKPAGKAVLSELDALRRHLIKGRNIGTWERRHIPAITMEIIRDDLTKGLTFDQAIGVARSSLPPGDDDKEGEQPRFKRSSHWPGWDLDQQLAHDFADDVRQALSHVFTRSLAQQLAHEWSIIASPGKNAEAWLQTTHPELQDRLTQALTPILRQIWRRGWALGEHSARVMVDRLQETTKAADNDEDVSSSSVIDEPSFRSWLEMIGAGILLGITSTQLDDLASLLSDGSDGDTSSDDLANDIQNLADSQGVIATISATELARAVSQAALASYMDMGVHTVSWLTAPSDVCRVCEDNAGAGDLLLGTPFPSGDLTPPAHPNCRCVLQPSSM